MTEDERAEVRAVLEDLQLEEADQDAERGYPSPRLLRASARLTKLLDDGEDTSLTT